MKRTYTGCTAPKVEWGYPTPSGPGTKPPTSWADGISTLAAFDGASSSETKFNFRNKKDIVTNKNHNANMQQCHLVNLK